VGSAIESLGQSQLFGTYAMNSQRKYRNSYTCVGFFAEVFAANPERVVEWQKLIERPGQDGDTQYWLRKALKLGRPGTSLAPGSDKRSGFTEVEESYVLQGAFFASGDAAYIRMLANRVELVDEVNPRLFIAGAETMVILAANAPQHPLLRQTLEAVRQEARPRTRELVDDLLTKDFALVLQELADMDRNSRDSDDFPEANKFLWQRPFPLAGPKPASP
jgi:hypothetical protein